MTDSEEVKNTEQTTKVEEEVNTKVEHLVEKPTIISESIETVIQQDTTTVATAAVKVIIESLGLKMISESSLSKEQKKLATNIYDSVKKSIETFINDPSINNTVKITKTIGQVIKQLETSTVDGKVPTGADKKAVAIQLGRILIKEVMPDDKGEDEVLMIYDIIAEPTLEAMIEVSRVVNVVVQELATKCCPSILDFFKRVKTVKSS